MSFPLKTAGIHSTGPNGCPNVVIGHDIETLLYLIYTVVA